MRHVLSNKKLFLILCIVAIILLIKEWWYLDTTLIQESTWKCEGEGKNKICEFTNFCISRNHGTFIISENEPPNINLINVGGDNELIWFKPKTMNRKIRAKYINEKLFVYGLYSPFHFSHFLYNGLIPLYSTMQEKGSTQSSWILRAGTYWNQHTKLDMDIPSNYEIVLDKKDLLTKKQMLAPYKPICFSKAIVGTGDRCSLWFCDRQIPSNHYESFKSHILNLPLDSNQQSQCLNETIVYKNNGFIRIGILNRGKTRHITNVPELIKELQKLDYAYISTIDFDSGCNLRSTAELVKDLDVLIAPFGNGLGSGLFMKNNSIVISIASRWYNEDWFKWPMTAIGRRIYNFECNSDKCQEYDKKLLQKLLDDHNIVLNDNELQRLLTEQNPVDVLTKFIPEHEWEIIEQYHKDVPRRIDIEAFIPFLNNILEDFDIKTKTSYIKLCQDNQCCNYDCTGPLDRNVFGNNNAWIL